MNTSGCRILAVLWLVGCGVGTGQHAHGQHAHGQHAQGHATGTVRDGAAGVGWKAGTAAVNITPDQPMWMAGYANRDRPAEGTLTDLWAKGLVIEDARGNRGLLLTLDLVGLDREFSTSVCERIAHEFDFRRGEIAICTSHTHTGPVVGRNLAPMHYGLLEPSQRQRVDAYAKTLEAKLIDVVDRAVEDLQPCRLTHGLGTATFAINRRNNRPASDVPMRRATRSLVGPVDHDVPVLAVRDAQHRLKAVVFGYACHATVLSSYQWSGDYPGFAQIEIERLYPGCQAMFWAGCGADQNPVPRRSDALAMHYGRRLAGAVDAVLMTSQMMEIAPKLETSYAEIALELDALPTTESLQRAAAEGTRYEQSRARLLLEQIEAGHPLQPTYPYPVGLWRLGDKVRWIMLGGEVVVDYALRLKGELKETVWVAAYCHDVMAYIPSRRVLREGGYEGATAMVYYGLPTTWAPTVENAIVAEVRRQATASPAPEIGRTVLTLMPGESNPRNSEGDFVQLKDGRLMFVYTKFVGGSSDHDAAELVSRFSDDGGETWSGTDASVVANEAGWNVMSVSLLRLADGRIALFYLRKHSLADCRPVVRFSSDEAASWGEATEIISDQEIGYYILNNDRVVQLASGRLVAPVALHNRPDWDQPDWRGEITCYLSDDGGESWRRCRTMQKGHDVEGRRIMAQEPGVVMLRDGRLLLWVRTDAGEQYRAYSSDSGETWTELEPMGIASPRSPASIERVPSTGNLLLVWNDHSSVPLADRKARTPLSVAISKDEGESWLPARVMHADPEGWYCYTAIEFIDDQILLGYVAGRQAPGKHLSTTRITKVPVAALVDP